MSDWRSSLLANILSHLPHPNSSTGPSSHHVPLGGTKIVKNAIHSITPGAQAPPDQPQNGTHQQDGSTDMECVVCRSDSSEVEFSTEPPTSACSHTPEVCLECLRQCRQRLDYYDVHRWATPEVFGRYDKLLLQNSLRTDEHYVFCLEPSCEAGQEHAGELNNIVTCYNCGTKQCFRHQVLWHEGLTCEQWDEYQKPTKRQQEMTDEWIRTQTKPCPGPGCGKRIQKDKGCDHMTCKKPGGCGHQFCWECLAPWLQIVEGDNSRHYDHCSYYSGPPGRNPAPPPIQPTAVVEPISPTVNNNQLRPILMPQPPPYWKRRRPEVPLPPYSRGHPISERRTLRRVHPVEGIDSIINNTVLYQDLSPVTPIRPGPPARPHSHQPNGEYHHRRTVSEQDGMLRRTRNSSSGISSLASHALPPLPHEGELAGRRLQKLHRAADVAALAQGRSPSSPSSPTSPHRPESMGAVAGPGPRTRLHKSPTRSTSTGAQQAISRPSRLTKARGRSES